MMNFFMNIIDRKKNYANVLFIAIDEPIKMQWLQLGDPIFLCDSI